MILELYKEKYPIPKGISLDQMEERIKWCRDQFGEDNVTFTMYHIWFNSDKDLMVYMLRYGR